MELASTDLYPLIRRLCKSPVIALEGKRPVEGKSRVEAKPPEVIVVTAIEAFAGVRYLLRSILSPVELLPFTVSLMIISFVIAFGLWKLSKWAWYSSLIISLFGVVSGSAALLHQNLGGVDILAEVPYVLLDAFVAVILLRKNVRATYRISRST